MTVREAALETLNLLEKGMLIQESLDYVFRNAGFSVEDRRLCADLAYGATRERLRLEFILARLLSRPRKLPRKMLFALILALYSLLSQRAASHAVLYGTVELIKKDFGQKLASVANGTLRSALRLGGALQDLQWYIQECHGDEWRAKCVFYGMPESIAGLWASEYGKENSLALMRRSGERPWMGLRVNASRPEAENMLHDLLNYGNGHKIGKWGVAFAPGEQPRMALNRELDYWLEKGALNRQAPGSMRVMEELGLAQWDRPVWDCCAGSGGKSAWLSEQGCPVSLVSDTSVKRLDNLRRIFKKSALPLPAIALADAGAPPIMIWNGHILADVPCSGLGVLARRPDLRERISLKGREKLQRAILEGTSGVLRPGHELAYITCALNPAENEKLIGEFLKDHRQMELLREWQTPHEHPWLEGMYGALLRRKP